MSAMGMSTEPDQHAHSEEDLDLIAELVLWHPMPTLTARQIVQHKCVNKTWAAWPSVNAVPMVMTRRADDSKDVYFPVFFHGAVTADRRTSWSWFGFHHPSGQIHSLPLLANLPPACTTAITTFLTESLQTQVVFS